MPDAVMLAIGQSLQAQSGNWYRNVQLLGSGGNADTFLAIATSGPTKGGLFAIKVFRNLSKPVRRQSFLEEVRFLQECNHPSIMRIFDEGQFYDFPFVIAEYLPNTLAHLIRARSLTSVMKLAFSLQLLSALEYLAGLPDPVIHRDIKPQNIFVKGHSCVLGDFGLLKRTSRSQPDDLAILRESLGAGMAFHYRTPDLVAYLNNGTPPTTKSEVFQLGLVLAELFTGRNPHQRPQAITDAVALHPLGKVPGAMGSKVENLIRRMLEFDPLQRDAATKLMDPWQGLFFEAVNMSHALEGRAF